MTLVGIVGAAATVVYLGPGAATVAVGPVAVDPFYPLLLAFLAVAGASAVELRRTADT
jgi:hypothetical protein